MVDLQLSAEQVAAIRESYAFVESAIDLGVLDNGGEPVTDARIRVPLSMLTRHGLIAGGAPGTGRTITLQLFAESLSSAGVPVLAADVKGDLSGIALPGVAGDELAAGAASAQPERPGGAEAGPRTTSGRGRQEKSVVESAAFKRFARSAGREMARSLFGTGRRA